MTEPIIYNFEIIGPRRKVLGPVALRDNVDAVEFAKQTIRTLGRDGSDYAGCSILISTDGRAVAIIPIIAAN